MNLYRLTMEIKSPIITPFQADTIFGHFSWALKYLEGEEKLEEFLEKLEINSSLMLISNGFPQGFLPRPILKPLSEKDTEILTDNYFGKDTKNRIRCLVALKELKKQSHLSWDIFRELKGNLTYFELYKKVFEGTYCPFWFRKKPCDLDNVIEECPKLNPDSIQRCKDISLDKASELVMHNTINRNAGRVKGMGGLFSEIETYYSPHSKIEIYLRSESFTKTDLQKIFQFIAKNGYGKDKSTGKGILEFHELVKFEEHDFGEPADSNGFMSLSSFVPERNDPINGYYEIITKFGKLDGDFAKSGFDGKDLHPFKKPLIMFKAGSTFYDSKDGCHKYYYGRLLQNIHKSEKIKHYGYAFPLKIRME